MKQHLVIKGIERTKLDNILSDSDYEISKRVFNDGEEGGWLIYSFSFLVEEEKQEALLIEGISYYLITSELEEWIINKSK